jgi:hypothetical protein
MTMYDSDMEAYVEPMRKRTPARAEEIEANIQWMKRAAAEGR